MSQSPNITALLDQSGWIQSLARSLVTDPNVADDLVQETWIDALEHQPNADTSVRGWLATVLRNNLSKLRRGEANRASRERLVSASEELETSTHDVVERAATHRDLVLAVMDLEEPYRSTILLRFFENLPYADIARRQRITRAAVNSRITRGLEFLRQKLEKSYGDRPAALRALAPLALCRLDGALPLITGVKLMYVATGIAAVGLAAAAVTQLGGSETTTFTPAAGGADEPTIAQLAGDPLEPLPVLAAPGRFEVEPVLEPNFRVPVDPTADLADDEVWQTELFDSRALPAGVESVRINTGAGSVRIERARGGALEIDAVVRADLEQVDASALTQYFDDHVSVSMDDGALEIEDAHSDENGWSVSLTVRVPGAFPLQANSGAGDVTVLYAPDKVLANSGAGTVRIEIPNEVVGSITANTGAGEVEIDVAGVDGSLVGNSGAGSVTARIGHWDSRGDVTLNAGAGDVRLTVPSGVVGTFDLKADLGSVEVPDSLGLDVRGSEMGARARGSIGAGEAKYSLQAGVGSVTLDFGESYQTR